MSTMDAVTAFKSWIGGEWKESRSGEWFASVNPADVGEVVGRFPNLLAEEATEAVEKAADAFPSWSDTPVTKRSDILLKTADLLEQRVTEYARELTREEGKLLSVAQQEVKRAAATFRFYAQEGLSLSGETFSTDDSASFVFSHREPLGVVAAITPWNFPISIPSRKIAPALVTGNTVVFKPASDTPLIALRLVECLSEAGLPAGVLNFVTGSASRIGSAITNHSLVKAVTFTGSTSAGEAIHRTLPITTRTQMELGGKNPILVMEDADLEKAVQLTIKGGFDLSGQACTGTSRVVVMRKVYDQYVEALVEAARKLKIGNGLLPDTQMGPLANANQMDTVLSYIQQGQAEGASLLYGGERLESKEHQRGYFIRPAVFADVTPNMTIAQEEIFGPVISVLTVDSFEEALSVANDVQYGLSASIVTRDIERANRFVRKIQSGTVKINRTTTGNLIQAPFGGLKKSSTSTFRESGRIGLEFFTQLKTVYYGY